MKIVMYVVVVLNRCLDLCFDVFWTIFLQKWGRPKWSVFHIFWLWAPLRPHMAPRNSFEFRACFPETRLSSGGCPKKVQRVLFGPPEDSFGAIIALWGTPETRLSSRRLPKMSQRCSCSLFNSKIQHEILFVTLLGPMSVLICFVCWPFSVLGKFGELCHTFGPNVCSCLFRM